LSELNGVYGKEKESAGSYAKAKGMISHEDRNVLLCMAKEKKQHEGMIKELIRLVEENYQEPPAFP